MEEKARRYDEAIELAKDSYNYPSYPGFIRADVVFPELKESEGDRIRKWIIDDLRYNMNNEPLNNSEYKKKAEIAITWLEQQGSQIISAITDEELSQAKKDAFNNALDKLEYSCENPTFEDGWNEAIWYLKKRNALQLGKKML